MVWWWCSRNNHMGNKMSESTCFDLAIAKPNLIFIADMQYILTPLWLIIKFLFDFPLWWLTFKFRVRWNVYLWYVGNKIIYFKENLWMRMYSMFFGIRPVFQHCLLQVMSQPIRPLSLAWSRNINTITLCNIQCCVLDSSTIGTYT